MTHFTTPEFWEHFGRLPEEIQRLAQKDFELLKQNPRYPSLRLKNRAVAKERVECLNWVWIGHHSEYDRLIS
jgi:hypothetical protein